MTWPRTPTSATELPNVRVFRGLKRKAPRKYRFLKPVVAPAQVSSEGLAANNPFKRYQTNPLGYAREVLKFSPWEGRNGKPGQADLFRDIGESVRAQLAGEPAVITYRIEAGNGPGKTIAASVLVNWFFDAFAPSITVTTAPTRRAVVEKLWKNIKKLRRGKGLPGRVLPAEAKMVKADEWFAVGQTTTDSHGQGTERFHGQHDEYLLFVLDEAEGIPAFVYDAVFAMLTGGKVLLVLVMANPRTRTSQFHKLGQQPGVKSYRWSCLDYPNVVDGAETIPGGTTRTWVVKSVQKWCEVVTEHSEDDHTFDLPFDVPPPDQGNGAHGPAGTVFKPNAEFMFRVMGVAPANVADDTLVPVGRYQAAVERGCVPQDDLFPTAARFGIDAAGYGADMGTLYARCGKRIWRPAQFSKQDPTEYWIKTREAALALRKDGVASLHIRIDAGGGFGIGVHDRLARDQELIDAFPDYQLFLVHFGGTPAQPESYADVATELYAEAAESLKGLAIVNPPEPLEGDLCERKYRWVNKSGVEVKKLEEKETFRKRMRAMGQGRSPDDGDGFALSAAPDFLFSSDQQWETF